MMNVVVDWFSSAQGWLFEHVVQHLVFAVGLGAYVEDAFEGTEWFLIGVCEIALLFLVLRPLESLLPVQAINDRRARWNDFIYTAIQRLGAFSVLMFFILTPVADATTEQLRLLGVPQFDLDTTLPGLAMHPLAAFLLYLVVLDFFDYWFHRAEHGFRWWWALHGLHHSQQYMNLWSDDRNHLLDDFLHDAYMAIIALVIGVEPSQFMLLIVASRSLQSLQHANVRLHFGWLGERLLVSPRFHRMHHAIGIGHESRGAGSLGGCNFAVLFPVWDMLFRTACFDKTFEATGVRDQLPPPVGKGRNYGRGFWEQQWLGLVRMVEFSRKRKAAP